MQKESPTLCGAHVRFKKLVRVLNIRDIWDVTQNVSAFKVSEFDEVNEANDLTAHSLDDILDRLKGSACGHEVIDDDNLVAFNIDGMTVTDTLTA